MAATLLLLVAVGALAALALWLAGRIRQEKLPMNSRFGIRSKLTQRNNVAWQAGHEAARPYLISVGGVGVLTVVGTLAVWLLGGRAAGELIVWGLPLSALIFQLALWLVAIVWANLAARYF